jgi:hypothetical protein
LTDKLFERFAAMYGKAWFDCWADVPMADVKDAWTHGLEHFSEERLGLALTACLTQCRFPPSLPEFAILCDQARVAPRPIDRQRFTELPAPKAWIDPLPDHEKKQDGKDWARRLIYRKARGESHVPYAEQSAREILLQIHDDIERRVTRNASTEEKAG